MPVVDGPAPSASPEIAPDALAPTRQPSSTTRPSPDGLHAYDSRRTSVGKWRVPHAKTASYWKLPVAYYPTVSALKGKHVAQPYLPWRASGFSTELSRASGLRTNNCLEGERLVDRQHSPCKANGLLADNVCKRLNYLTHLPQKTSGYIRRYLTWRAV